LKFLPQGRPNMLQVHLAKNCNKCPDDIRLKYTNIIIEDENDVSSKKRNFQTVLNDHWDNDAEIPISKIKVIDRAWLKAFVACGLPFSAIENPFFIDAIKSLRTSYNPPTRGRLSGTLLDHEVISINSKVNNILLKSNNLTLGKF